MSKRKLGRGLQALLGVDYEEDGPLEVAPEGLDDPAGPTVHADLVHLPVAGIDRNPYQPRTEFDPEELASLTDSIRLHGVIQPIVVRAANGRFQLVAGERRWRAAQDAGLTTIPARVIELDEQQTCEIALVENLQRRDLNAIEKAHAFQAYLERFGSTHEELAHRMGVDRSTVTNLVRLLELPDAVQHAVRVGQVTFGHARALLACEDPVEQIALCRRITAESLSVRQVEELARQSKAGVDPVSAKPTPKKAEKSNHLVSLENDLRHRLGARVEILPKAKDKGLISIHFQSHEEFERLVGLLNGR